MKKKATVINLMLNFALFFFSPTFAICWMEYFYTTGNVTFGDINLSSNKSGGVGGGGLKVFFLLFQRRYTFSNLCRQYSWRNVL